MGAEMEAIKVHLMSSDVRLQAAPPIPSQRHTTFRTFQTSGSETTNTAILILAQIANRKRAVVTVVGQSSDLAYICGSEADALSLSGAITMGLQVVPLEGNDEMWVGIPAGTSLAFGVVSEFEVTGR